MLLVSILKMSRLTILLLTSDTLLSKKKFDLKALILVWHSKQMLLTDTVGYCRKHHTLLWVLGWMDQLFRRQTSRSLLDLDLIPGRNKMIGEPALIPWRSIRS